MLESKRGSGAVGVADLRRRRAVGGGGGGPLPLADEVPRGPHLGVLVTTDGRRARRRGGEGRSLAKICGWNGRRRNQKCCARWSTDITGDILADGARLLEEPPPPKRRGSATEQGPINRSGLGTL